MGGAINKDVVVLVFVRLRQCNRAATSFGSLSYRNPHSCIRIMGFRRRRRRATKKLSQPCEQVFEKRHRKIMLFPAPKNNKIANRRLNDKRHHVTEPHHPLTPEATAQPSRNQKAKPTTLRRTSVQATALRHGEKPEKTSCTAEARRRI